MLLEAIEPMVVLMRDSIILGDDLEATLNAELDNAREIGIIRHWGRVAKYELSLKDERGE